MLQIAKGIKPLLLALILGLSMMVARLQAGEEPPMVPLADSPTPICDITYSVDTTFTLAESPYVVCGSYPPVAEPGVTLTVEPGVEIQFEANAGLTVEGTLIAAGTALQPIILTGVGKTPGSWKGLTIAGSPGYPSVGSNLSHVTIEYGGLAFANSANLFVEHAQVSISHSTFRYGAKHGLHIWQDGQVDISDSSFIGNGAANSGYAVLYTDGTANPKLARLSAVGNGLDAVGLGGYAYLDGNHLWEFTGIPYVVIGSISVEPAAVLTVEPGVEVRFGQLQSLDVAGWLKAVGTPTEPITFTATTKTPGWWDGIIVSKGLATLDHVTVEYGGSVFGNLAVSNGQLSVQHSLIRHSGKHGIQANGDTRIVVENSSIVDNANFGIMNGSVAAEDIVLAAYNWWGHSGGPTVSGGCNSGGLGQQVSTGSVIFRPFLTSADQELEPGVLPGEALVLSLAPRRWYAPADGSTRIWVDLSLVDGLGRPLPGREVQLKAKGGSVSSVAVTDVQGKALAYVTSSQMGDVELTAVLYDKTDCEFVRTGSSLVTFTSAGEDGLFPEMEAPYFNGRLKANPKPLVRGVPTTISALLSNPNDFPITLDVTFSFESVHIGMTFLPISQLNDVVLQANEERELSVSWTPSVSGYYCFQFEYVLHTPAPAAATLNGPGGSTSGGNGETLPAPLMSPQAKNSIDKAQRAISAIDDASFLLELAGGPGGAIFSLFQGQGIGNILDFNWETTGAANCALGGGDNCGGWKGPRLTLPGGSIGNLREDPPSQDFREIITIEKIPFPPAVPGPDMPAERAAAMNKWVEVSLEMLNGLFAAVVSYDRYAGASEANEFVWAARQTGAYLHYLQLAGGAMIDSADALDALMVQLEAEGITDVYVQEADFLAYQQRLAQQGFNADELEAAWLVGFNEEAIEAIRQRRLSLNPANVAGSQLPKWATLSAALREAGSAIANPPAFSISISASGASVSNGETVSGVAVGAPTSPTETSHNLVRVFETESSFLVGNPTGQVATVELRARPLNLPADWMVAISPTSVPLEPGEYVTATATIIPGTAVTQGTSPRVAIEGFIDGELIGGVVIDVAVPSYFDPDLLFPELIFSNGFESE